MVRWAMSYWKTMRNRKGKYLCAVGTPTCHMSQPPPLFALSLFFLLLSFSPPCISVFPQECVSPQYLSLDGGRVSWCSADGQSVTECGGSGCVGRRRRVRGEESHERLSCCSAPRFRLHSGNMSRNIRTHICQYMRTQTRSWIDTRPRWLSLVRLQYRWLLQSQLSISLHLRLATTILSLSLKILTNALQFWHFDWDRKIRKHCQRHDGLKHCIE